MEQLLKAYFYHLGSIIQSTLLLFVSAALCVGASLCRTCVFVLCVPLWCFVKRVTAKQKHFVVVCVSRWVIRLPHAGLSKTPSRGHNFKIREPLTSFSSYQTLRGVRGSVSFRIFPTTTEMRTKAERETAKLSRSLEVLFPVLGLPSSLKSRHEKVCV